MWITLQRQGLTVQVWNCTVDDVLNKLISIIYTNKMHLFFDSSSLHNSTVKQFWLRSIMGWVTWNVFRKTWGKNILKSLVLVCERKSTILKVIELIRCLQNHYILRVITDGRFWPVRIFNEISSCEIL